MSAVMRVADQQTILARDTAMQIFKTVRCFPFRSPSIFDCRLNFSSPPSLQFGNLNQISVDPSIAIVPQDSYSTSIVSHSEQSDMVILPWNVGSASLPVDDEGAISDLPTAAGASGSNLAEVLFAADSAAHPYTKNFVRRVFAESPRDVSTSTTLATYAFY